MTQENKSALPPVLPGGRPVFAGNLYGVASMVVWATGFPAADILLDSWNPLALIAARFLLAVTLLIPLWIVLDGPRMVLGARWGRGTFVGCLSFGVGAYLLVVAQWLTDPVTVAVIAAASPIAGTIIEMFYVGRRLRLSFAVGLAASLIGGVVATGSAPPGQIGLGALAAVTSCFLFSWGSHMAVRDFPDLSVTGRTTITLAGGLVATGAAFLVAYFLGIVPVPPDILNDRNLGLLAIYAVGGMALSQFLWIAAVGQLGVAVAAFHINIAPLYVMLILLALGGVWSWPQVIGAAIVALGVVLAQR
jgi:drug/metabolite transporter (DMT)-like permease